MEVIKAITLKGGKLQMLTIFVIALISCRQEPLNNSDSSSDSSNVHIAKEGYIFLQSADSAKPIPLLINYYEVGDQKIFQGDILVNPSTDKEAFMKEGFNPAVYSVFGGRWPENTVIYTIADQLPEKQKKEIVSAMHLWQSLTNIRFRQRDRQKDAGKVFVAFVPNETGPMSTSIGMDHKLQYVYISSKTDIGNIRHEIGHVIGLWHEHSRPDRDNYIVVQKKNIEKGKERNFDTVSGIFMTPYDSQSIMHYSRYAFSIDSGKLETIRPSKTCLCENMGQRETPSACDIEGVNQMYP